MISAFLQWLGFGLCHQLPERSFFGGGIQAPVCARDTGIYIGFVVSLALVALLHRGERRRGFPGAAAWIVFGLLVAWMGFDGFSSYAGLRTTTNELRLITGLGVGFASAAILAPMLNEELWKRSSSARILDPTWRLAVWVVAMPVTWAALWWLAPLLGIAYPLLIALCILATFTAINLVIIGMLPPFDRAADRISQLILPATIALAVTFVEIWLAGLMRVALFALAGVSS